MPTTQEWPVPGLEHKRRMRRARLTRYAGFGIVALLCVAFVRSSLTGSHLGLVVAQVAFLTAPLAATVSSGLCFFRSARASRERRVWGAMTFLMGALLVGESAFSAYQVFAGGPPPSPGVADIGFGAGIVALFTLLVVLAGLGTLVPATRARVIADSVVLLALVDALLYAFWVRGLLGAVVDTVDAGIATVYTLQAVAAAAVAFFLWLGNRERRAPRWVFDLGAAFVVYALGLTLWPAWNIADVLSESVVIQFTAELAYLVGYGLIATAALQRALGGESWEPPPPSLLREQERPWPGVIMSATIAAAMVALVALTIRSPIGSREFGVFFAATAIAGIGILVRSASASVEQAHLRHDSLSDPVSGVGNHRSFKDTLSAWIAEADRCATRVGLVALDLDDFAVVNHTRGFDAGDDVLRAVARALQSVFGTDDAVFRLAGDEFAVLVPTSDGEIVERRARAFLSAIRTVESEGVPMSASIGVAVYPEDASDADGLQRAAEAARAWAKCHGKARIVLASSGVSPALDADECVRLAEEGMRLDLARGLSAAVDARDSANPYHGRNVAALAVLVGQRLGLSSDDLARVEAAALLHDVGKLALPDEVLCSSGKGAALRRREHPALGERFCESIGFSDVSAWIRAHHERWDGSGYPDGLSGDEIPIASRLLALCSAYDVLTSGQSDRGALSRGAALQEIDLGLGSRFDPELAEVFISVVGDHGALGWVDPTELAS